MSFTDHYRNAMEIHPRETREQFILRYASMRPVAEGMTLWDWKNRVSLASSLATGDHAHRTLWGHTQLDLMHAMNLAMAHARDNAQPSPGQNDSIEQGLSMALLGMQETLRSIRMNDALQAHGIGDIDPQALAIEIMADMKKANQLFDQLEHPDKPRQR